MTEAKRECCDTTVAMYHLAECNRPGKGEPFDGPTRTWCCNTGVNGPHEEGCPFDPEAFRPSYIMRGRQNGKQQMYHRLKAADEACGGARVDPAWRNGVWPAPLWQREDRRAVDRSFENEVRLHG